VIKLKNERGLVITNGNIYTLNTGHPRAEAMAIRGDKIFALGTTKEIRPFIQDGYKEMDLGGKTVLPGFIDAHCHALSFGMNLKTWLGVFDTESIEEMKEKVAQRVRHAKRGDWIKGRGWARGLLDRLPTRYDFDQVAPDNPVILVDGPGHLSVLNSKALEVAGIDRNTVFEGRGKIDKDPSTGEPTGILRDVATFKLAFLKGPQPSADEFLEAAKLICERAARVGITSISEMLTIYPSEDEKNGGYTGVGIRPFVTLYRRGELPIRVRFMVHAYQHWGDPHDHTNLDRLIGLGLSSGIGDDRLEIGGIKTLCDGSIISNTGAMREPYSSDPTTKGILYYNQQQLNELVLKANQNDFQMEVHAHGDQAVDLTLGAYKHSFNNYPPAKDLRNIITHARILHDDQIRKIRDLGLMFNGVPGTDGWEPTRLAAEAINVGKERSRLISRIRSLIDEGIMVTGGSDCHPCHTFDPIHIIYRMVNKENFSYEDPLTLDEAIKLWTTNAAYVGFAEDKKGSLECGKLADFVVISHDPYDMNLGDINKIEVEKTFVGGERVWNKDES
jgi:predicted amidohydrolase YtcJ